MSDNNDFNNLEMKNGNDHQLAKPDNANFNPRNLPSTDVRELLPPLEEEIHLRDYLDVLVRRKWTVISILLVIFFGAAIFTLATTPLFLAKSVIKVSAQESKTTKFESLQSDIVKMKEFQQTQINLLQSEQVAGRVITTLALDKSPVFNRKITLNSDDDAGIMSQIKELISMAKDFIRFKDDSNEAELSPQAQVLILQDQLLRKFRSSLQVSPVRNSELINLSFESSDAKLSAAVVNTTMREFVNMHMDSRLEASRIASRFLDRQIQSAQIKLEDSEKQITRYSRHIGIVSLDPKLNMVMKQLEELNSALATARAVRISKEATYQQAISSNKNNLSQVLTDELIQDLKQKHTMLESEYQDLSVTFKAEYPKMKQLKARMNKIKGQLELEKQAIIDAIKNDYMTALKTQAYLNEKTEEQKLRAINLNDKATQYKILQREVNTNKSIYQSLLQRAKEIEASVGAAVTNIQIVDQARVPIYPYKPKVALNFLLGMVLGLFGGIGVAFLLEYMDNTIKNPDELATRYHIPILGLIPYDKGKDTSREVMATKYYNDPRAPISESIRTAMTSIDLSAPNQPPKSILVTSILPGAGKSTISCNMALSYLSTGGKCLLIDVDLRKPSLHKVFSTGSRSKGLSSVLTGLEKLQNVIHKTEYDGLHFISSGPLPPNPAELISSRRMRLLLEVACEHYDHVILDSPPYQGFAELLVLANMVDGTILVTVEGDTPREGVSHFRKSLLNIGGNILGSIMNKTGQKKGYGSYGGYKYYSYAYNYEYGKDGKS